MESISSMQTYFAWRALKGHLDTERTLEDHLKGT